MDTDNRSKLIPNGEPAKWRGGDEEILGYEQSSWRKRIVHMFRLISDEDQSVMDLGAGHMYLRNLLNDTVQYIPVDYRKIAEDAVVCDFDQYEFPDNKVDVIVCAGILEYIQDLEWFLQCCVSHCRKLLVSYKGKEKYPEAPYHTEQVIDFLRTENFILTERDDSLDGWTFIGCFEKVAPDTLHKNKKCTGCGACVNKCLQEALCLEYDADGFLKPILDQEKCVNCGQCITACPVIRTGYKCHNDNMPICYAAWAKDEIRANSSSGGAFSVMAEEVIRKNGYVFGVEWTEDFFCKHVGIHCREDIVKLRYSKYMQSNTGYTFREVKDLLETGKLVMYVGCPCQIAGLKSFLGTDYEMLITVDLVCFCAPSNVLFRKYLDENYGLENVKTVTFRAKNVTRWSPYGYRVEFNDGRVLYPSKEKDAYQTVFHEVLARNDVCEDCQFRGFPREGDITIGDFWGITEHDPSWNDTKGTSIILGNTHKGMQFIQKLKTAGSFQRIEEVPLSWCRHKGNGFCRDGRSGHAGREYFRQLIKDHLFKDAVADALKNGHDVGMVCMCNFNFGNNVTNFALYQVLRDMGYTVLLMDLPQERVSGSSMERLQKFDKFLENPFSEYDIADLYQTKSDVQKEGKKCRFYLVTSDQLWRDIIIQLGNYHTALDWAESYKYKMSYGTSFGVDIEEGTLENNKKKGYLLRRFQRISVREKSGQRLLQEEHQIEAEVVLDPVFLCGKGYYERMAHVGSLRLPKQKFLGVYALDMCDEIEAAARIIKKHFHLSENCLVLDEGIAKEMPKNYVLQPLADVAVEEWIAMIASCSFLLTDSFHGMCMALIFQKPFCVIFSRENWRGYSRICDYLDMLGLTDRIMNDYDEQKLLCILDQEIDYARVSDILNREIVRSRKWLSDSLQEARHWKGSYDTYDCCLRIMQEFERLEQCTAIRNSKIRHEIFINRLAEQAEKMKEIQTLERTADKVEIVGWGTGACFRRNIEKIKRICDMKYVCDNKPDKWGKEVTEGVLCISPGQLSEMRDTGVLIMVDSPGTSMEIVHELMKMDVTTFDHVENWLKAVFDDR